MNPFKPLSRNVFRLSSDHRQSAATVTDESKEHRGKHFSQITSMGAGM